MVLMEEWTTHWSVWRVQRWILAIEEFRNNKKHITNQWGKSCSYWGNSGFIEKSHNVISYKMGAEKVD